MITKKLILKISIITIPLGFFIVPMTRSYFIDNAVLDGNIITTGYWETTDIELKKPLDGHTYFLGNKIHILWKVKNARPHSELEFKLFLLDLDEDGENQRELNSDELECGPPAKADIYERWCFWEPGEEDLGEHKIRVEVTDGFGSDENEEHFTIKERPGNPDQPGGKNIPSETSKNPDKDISLQDINDTSFLDPEGEIEIPDDGSGLDSEEEMNDPDDAKITDGEDTTQEDIEDIPETEGTETE